MGTKIWLSMHPRNVGSDSVRPPRITPAPLSHICVQVSTFGALFISRQIQFWENLGQTSGDYPIYRQNPRRSAFSDMKSARAAFGQLEKTRSVTYSTDLELG